MKGGLKEQVFELITKGELSESLERLKRGFADQPEQYHALVKLSFRLNAFKLRRESGTISYQDEKIEENTLIDRIIQFTNNNCISASEKHTFQDQHISNIYHTGLLARQNHFFHASAGTYQKLKNLMFDFNRRVYVTTLWGMQGIGKTFLAHKLANDLTDQGKFQLAWQLDCSESATIIEDYRQLAKCLGLSVPKLEEELIGKVHDFLNHTDLSWLLIFDNACDDANLESELFRFENKYFPNATKSSKQIIVTSTNRRWSRHYRNILLKEWSEEDCYEYLQTEGIKCTRAESDILHGQFEGLPIALVQAANYINNCTISVPLFIRLLDENKQSLLAIGIDIYRRKNGNFISAIILAYEKLKKSLPVQAQLLISMLSFFGSSSIPIIYISHLLSTQEKLPEHFFDEDNPLADIEECIKAIEELINSSLLKNKGEDMFSMHRLVSESIRWYVKKDTEKYFKIQEELLKVFYVSFEPQETFYKYLSPTMSLMAPHLEYLLDLIEPFERFKSEYRHFILALNYRMAMFKLALSDKEAATQRTIVIHSYLNEDKQLAKDEKVVYLSKSLALKLCYPSQFPPYSEEQTAAISKLLDLKDFFQKHDYPQEVLVALNRLGLACMRNQELDKAQDYFEQAINIGNYDFLHSHMGTLLFEAGHFRLAEEKISYSNTLALKINNDYTVGLNNITLGMLRGLKGNTQEAIHNLKNAIETFKSLGEKRFMAYAIYPFLSFSLDTGQFEAQDEHLYQKFLSFEPVLASDSKYRLFATTLALRFAIRDNKHQLVDQLYINLCSNEYTLQYYVNETMAASTFLSVAIYYYQNDDPQEAIQALQKAIKYKEKMSAFHLTDELNYWYESIQKEV